MLLHNKKILLGSASPRRRELLKQILHSPFKTEVADIEEVYPNEMPVEKVPEFLAEAKALFLSKLFKGYTIISADTVVILKGNILGKPEDHAHAVEMLNKLSANKHTVISGVCIINGTEIEKFSDHTDVYFKKLDQEEIEYYVKNFKPFDKAGAYGIQEWIGMCGIEKISGSYFNVMGLPLHKLYSKLKKIQ